MRRPANCPSLEPTMLVVSEDGSATDSGLDGLLGPSAGRGPPGTRGSVEERR